MPSSIPFRTPEVDRDIEPTRWNSSVKEWTAVLHSCLALSLQDFDHQLRTSDSLATFLSAYVRELCSQKVEGPPLQPSKELHYECFLLTRRAWFSVEAPRSLLTVSFLGKFCLLYSHASGLPEILGHLWRDKALGESVELQNEKTILQQQLESSEHLEKMTHSSSLSEAKAFVNACPEYGKFLMTGTDFLDAVEAAWERGSEGLKKKLVLFAYSCLISLTRGENMSLSVLADILYALRMSHEKRSVSQSFLADMITNTPLLHKCRRVATRVKSERLNDTVDELETIGVPHRRRRRSASKMLGHQTRTSALEPDTAAISQVKELFPDLGEGYIAALLDENAQNPEAVTAHLLENTLPKNLLDMDRTQSLRQYKQQMMRLGDTLSPHNPRHNIYDDDELDHLQISAQKIHIGKKKDLTLSTPTNKNIILAALAALDPDDDEHDDTYDAEDVGGTIDTASPEEESADRKVAFPGEDILYAWWTSTPQVFSRDATTRSSTLRATLRQETGLTDEAIEGWSLMLEREPQRLRGIRARVALPTISQPRLESSTWQNSQHSDYEARSHHQSAARGQGMPSRRATNRGRGGNVHTDSSASEASTQRDRQNKDVNKASRANHNRRNQRAKKIARAGF